MRRSVWALLAVGVLSAALQRLPLPAAASVPGVCPGDCNGGGDVTVNELITLVNIALGNTPLQACENGNLNADTQITVDEILRAVNNALNGCPPDASGVLLEGPPDMMALAAVHDLDLEHGSPGSELDTEGKRTLIRTRIEFGFTPGATVGQVNTLLDSVGGRIVMMLSSVPILLVRIPDPGSVDALNALVGSVAAKPIVRFVHKAYLPKPDVLPNNFSPLPVEPDFSKIDHHLAVRAPAAWNARQAIRTGQQATVVIQDFFGDGPPVSAPGGGFDVRIGEPDDFVTGVALCGRNCEHGYHVTGIVAASFGGTAHCSVPFDNGALRDCATGMFSGTTPLRGVDLASNISGSGADDKTILILKQLAAQGVNGILNTSLGNACGAVAGTCVQAEEARQEAPVWIEKVRLSGLEEHFLHLASAGNVNPDFPDLDNASDNSPYSAAALAPDLQSGGVAVPNLTNVLVIENGINTPAPPYEIGCLSNSSFIGGHLSAIGTDVWSLVDAAKGAGNKTGTSMSTPQVAGLASYVWALAPELSPQQVAGVLQATARRDFTYSLRGVDADCYGAAVQPAPTIDAYEAVLSLDAAALPTVANAPIRLAILNVNDDGDSKNKFDEADLDDFLREYAPGGVAIEPTGPDFSRYDLNGDGFTGGIRTAKFDLDREGSTHLGAPVYSIVTQSLDDLPVSFDETQLTDMHILCYYAYSDLYTGDSDARKQRLTGLCTTITVTVDPAAVTLAAGGSQQFAATVRGTTDPRVTWRVVTGAGTISASGLFTASQSMGTSTVRAISVADPNAFADATVHTGAGMSPIRITGNAAAISASATVCVTVFDCLDDNPPSKSVSFSAASFTFADGVSATLARGGAFGTAAADGSASLTATFAVDPATNRVTLTADGASSGSASFHLIDVSGEGGVQVGGGGGVVIDLEFDVTAPIQFTLTGAAEGSVEAFAFINLLNSDNRVLAQADHGSVATSGTLPVGSYGFKAGARSTPAFFFFDGDDNDVTANQSTTLSLSLRLGP